MGAGEGSDYITMAHSLAYCWCSDVRLRIGIHMQCMQKHRRIHTILYVLLIIYQRTTSEFFFSYQNINNRTIIVAGIIEVGCQCLPPTHSSCTFEAASARCRGSRFSPPAAT